MTDRVGWILDLRLLPILQLEPNHRLPMEHAPPNGKPFPTFRARHGRVYGRT